MELGSAGSSSNSSSSSSSSDSLNGLKFGKKIYFENANGPGVGSSASGGRPPTAPAKKGKVGVGPGGGEPPRCQVEGCKLDLSGAKAYYSRHKVCGMHSKSPKVIVSGLEQRFCQQCSRFHLLPEFDQGKRSCRRRLAGHNERRRKPPPGNLLSARYGNLSSPFLENNGRSGSFVLDFSKYPARTGTDPWPNTRSSERPVDYQQTTNMGKFPPPMWHHHNPESSPSEIQVQGSTAARACYSEIPSGEESFNGFSACSRALSLLSNQQQPLGSSSRDHRFSSLGINGYVNANGNPMVQSSSHCDSIDGFSSPSFWGFKGSNECNSSSSSHEMHPDLGLGHHQLSQPSASCQYSEEIDLDQQSERDYLMLEHSRGYDSSLHNLHWSL